MPRRQLTKPREMEALPGAADLPELTPNQQEFVRGILEGKSGADAYRAAYDCRNSGDKTIWVEASKLRHNPDVALWLAAARKAELGAATRTLDQHIRRLDSLQQIAIEAGNIGAAVAAEQSIGKVSGHYVEQYRDVTERDPLETLTELARISPKLAEAIAEHHSLKVINQGSADHRSPEPAQIEQQSGG